jgi:phosphatidylinositol kinase/protein kinase (PI-3  family)
VCFVSICIYIITLSFAQKHEFLARELFHAAFLSCWVQLYDKLKDDLRGNVEIALNSPTISAEIVQVCVYVYVYVNV